MWCESRAVNISPGSGAQGVIIATLAPPRGLPPLVMWHRLSRFPLALPLSGCFFPGTHAAPSFTSLQSCSKVMLFGEVFPDCFTHPQRQTWPMSPSSQKTQEYNMSHK